MKIENQVCTWEQAQKFKELGLVQNVANHEWIWIRNIPTGLWQLHSSISNPPTLKLNTTRCGEIYLQNLKYNNIENKVEVKFASAFTTAELGCMINWDLVSISPPYSLVTLPASSEWTLHTNEIDISNSVEAHARAAMLIHLLENNLITAEQANERLTQPSPYFSHTKKT